MKKRNKYMLTFLGVMGLLCTVPALQRAQASAVQQSYNAPTTQTQVNQVNQPQPSIRLGSTYGRRYSRHIANAYDISQWQGHLTQRQAYRLKPEVNFMVLRTQGGDYKDSEINHNESIMNRAHIPYGVYSYSYYTSPSHAAGEANELYDRSPHAKFYANDIEQNSTSSLAALNKSTQQWAYAMKARTHKPVILYSGLYFMNNLSAKTRRAYDALWVAAYGPEPNPRYHYDLWQKTSAQYSPALGQRVDADVFPHGVDKPLSYWTGNSHYSSHHYHHYVKHVYVRHIRRPRVNMALIHQARNLSGRLKTYTHILKTQKGSAERYAFEVNSLQKQSYRFMKRYYRRYTNVVRHTLWLFSNALRTARTRTHRGSIFDQVPPEYYRSPNLHRFHVIDRTGFYLYNPRTNRRMRHVKRGALLTNTHYVYRRYNGGWITKLVGYYQGRRYMFTSRKNCVHW